MRHRFRTLSACTIIFEYAIYAVQLFLNINSKTTDTENKIRIIELYFTIVGKLNIKKIIPFLYISTLVTLTHAQSNEPIEKQTRFFNINATWGEVKSGNVALELYATFGNATTAVIYNPIICSLFADENNKIIAIGKGQIAAKIDYRRRLDLGWELKLPIEIAKKISAIKVFLKEQTLECDDEKASQRNSIALFERINAFQEKVQPSERESSGRILINRCMAQIRERYERSSTDAYGRAREVSFNELTFAQLLQPGMHKYGQNQALLFNAIAVSEGDNRRTSVITYRIFCIVDDKYDIVGIERELRSAGGRL